jgi:hypothetical protein
VEGERKLDEGACTEGKDDKPEPKDREDVRLNSDWKRGASLASHEKRPPGIYGERATVLGLCANYIGKTASDFTKRLERACYGDETGCQLQTMMFTSILITDTKRTPCQAEATLSPDNDASRHVVIPFQNQNCNPRLKRDQ